MKFVALSIVVSAVLTGLCIWRRGRGNRHLWAEVFVDMATGVLFSLLFLWIYPNGFYHKSNLLGWAIMLFILLWFLTNAVLKLQSGKQLRDTGIRVVVSVAVWCFLCHAFGSGTVRQFPKRLDVMRAVLLALHGVLSFVWIIMGPLAKRVPDRLRRVLRIVFLAMTPVFMVVLCEAAQEARFPNIQPLSISVAIVLCALISCAVFLVVPSGARVWASWVLMTIAFLTGCISQALVGFRNYPLMANDLYNIATAATVAGGYTYQVSAGTLKAIEFIFLILILFEWCVGYRKHVKPEIPESEIPKSEIPKSETPKSEIPKNEILKNEISESEIPENEILKSEIPENEILKSEIPIDLSEMQDPKSAAKKEKTGWIWRYVLRLAGAACCLLTIVLWIANVDFQENYTGEVYFWRPAKTYHTAGFLPSFIVTWQHLTIEKPEGYTPEHVGEILESAGTQNHSEESAAGTEQTPSVIVVMNESFCDLSVLGPVACTEDHLQFFHSLKEDPGTLQYGYDYVSTYGGGTAKTEWEFLTGMSCAFLPQKIAYTEMSLAGVPSLSHVFRQQGYRTIAMHPYIPENYKRDVVYEILGFEQFLSQDDYGDMELVREYCSDRYDYQKLLEVLEEEEGPAFIFNVTMQNHGGYEIEELDPELVVDVDEGLEKYTDFVTYESLLKLSDDALKYLIDGLKNCDRPVVLCFFGDHLCGLSDKTLNSIRKQERQPDKSAVESEQELFKVPYMIWANFEVDPETDAELESSDAEGYNITSPGMMGTMTAAYAGIRRTNYLNWLLQARKQIPALNFIGYYGSDAIWHFLSEETGDTELLKDMEYVQYNALADKKNRLEKEYNLDAGG